MTFRYQNELEDLLLQYPGIILANEVNENRVLLKGAVKVKNCWYELKLNCPHFPRVEAIECQVLQLHRFRNLNAASETNINADWSVSEFIEQLPKLLLHKNKDEEVEEEEGRDGLKLYSAKDVEVYKEIATLYAPEAYRMQMSGDDSRIRFSSFADHMEEHFIELELPSLRVREHSLPDCMPWQEMLEKCQNLTTLIAQFEKYLVELQPFYENFNDIDELCHVVQPVKPNTKHNWRIFMLRERVFLKLTITDPFAPIPSMILRIIGPTRDVEELRRMYRDGLPHWDPDLLVHKNLLRIFDLCFFPMPPQANINPQEKLDESDEETQSMCNICYCYLLENGEIPLVSCDNVYCSLIFHASCLREWFNTLADGKEYLEVCFGACPFCKAKMSTSFAELLES